MRLSSTFGQPLGLAARRRLDLAFFLVMTAAATVGLSCIIRPAASKLPRTAFVLPPPERRELAHERPPMPEEQVPPAFVAAVTRGDLDGMEKAWSKGMPLDEMLFVAFGPGDPRCVAWLLDHGADPRQGEDTPNAALLVADELPEITAILLSRGAREPSLVAAAHAGAVNAVTRILSAQPRVDAHAGAPLDAAFASWRNGSDSRRLIASLLVAHGARATGDTVGAILELGEPDSTVMLDLVLDHLDPGATAAALSRWEAFALPRIATKLVGKGVAWAWHDGEEDAAAPLVAAVQRSDRDAVRFLLDAGAPVNHVFEDGSTALETAVGTLDGTPAPARVVELLLARGADVNRRLYDGRTPLFAAAEVGDLRAIHALLDHGARVSDLVLDDTALEAAEQNGHLDAARLLHSRGGRRARKE